MPTVALHRRTHRSAALAGLSVLAIASALMVVQRSAGEFGFARDGAAAVAGPVAGAGSAVNEGVARVWSGWFAGDELRSENEALKAEVAQLRLEKATLADRVAEMEDASVVTQALPDWADRLTWARVLGEVPDKGARRLWIEVGADDAIATGQIVVSADGVLGRVYSVHGRRAIVQLLTDAASRWGGQVAGRGELGVLEGTGSEERLVLRLETTAATVEVGDGVATSGMRGSAATAGLALGTVVDVTVGDEGERHAVVAPTASAKGLRHAFVLDESQISWEPER